MGSSLSAYHWFNGKQIPEFNPNLPSQKRRSLCLEALCSPCSLLQPHPPFQSAVAAHHQGPPMSSLAPRGVLTHLPPCTEPWRNAAALAMLLPISPAGSGSRGTSRLRVPPAGLIAAGAPAAFQGGLSSRVPAQWEPKPFPVSVAFRRAAFRTGGLRCRSTDGRGIAQRTPLQKTQLNV